MAELRRLLSDITQIDGVDSAILASRDGFVLESVSSGEIDPEAIGAIVSSGIKAYEGLGPEMNVGELIQGMIEYKSGFVMISLVTNDAVLAVAANSGANLGNVRFRVIRIAADIGRVV